VASSLGNLRLHLRRVDSTNTRARQLAAAGAPHGTLVTASEQSAGRGRQGRTWSAPPNAALLCSLLLRRAPRLLPLAAGVAVSETCERLGCGPALIKWPNDVLVDGLKVAGILVEGRPQEGWSVLGIGLNVAVRLDDLPPELTGRAGTLGLSSGELERALGCLLERLAPWLSAEEPAVLDAVRARDALLGRPVAWSGGGAGVAAGLDGAGRLLVDPDGGGDRLALDAGEVHLAPTAPGPA
jgi:BirA family biotin operon repressor/biotin-[acetyl-CoA-carboxylase] ligase